MGIGIKLGHIALFSKYHHSYIAEGTRVIENKML